MKNTYVDGLMGCDRNFILKIGLVDVSIMGEHRDFSGLLVHIERNLNDGVKERADVNVVDHDVLSGTLNHDALVSAKDEHGGVLV